jgi:hypothetical protein
MAKSNEDTILVATQAIHTGTRIVHRGETFRVGHPFLEGRESLFAPLVVDNEFEAPASKPPAK